MVNWLAEHRIYLRLQEVHGAIPIHQNPSSNRCGRYRKLGRPNPKRNERKKTIRWIAKSIATTRSMRACVCDVWIVSYRWFGVFRFKRSQRTSNCWNVIYCFILTRIVIQFCIEFLKAWPHYLIDERFSYRFTNFSNDPCVFLCVFWFKETIENEVIFFLLFLSVCVFFCWFTSNNFDDSITISFFI